MNEKWIYEEMNSGSLAVAVTAEAVAEVAATVARAEADLFARRRARQRAGRRPLDSETPEDDL